MLLIRQGVDVEELADGLEDGAGIFGDLTLRDEPLLLDAENINCAEDAHKQEGQLIGAVGAFLVQHLEHAAVGKGAQRVEKAVDHGDGDGDPALGVVVVGGILPGSAELFVLMGFDKAEGDDADGDQRHGNQRDGGQVLTDAGGDKGQNRNDRAGAVADGAGDRKLDIAKPQIADGHGQDVQHGDRQIREDHVPAHFHAVKEDLVCRVQTHHKAHRHDHFQVTVLIVCVLAADLGKQVRTAPA